MGEYLSRPVVMYVPVLFLVLDSPTADDIAALEIGVRFFVLFFFLV